MSCLHVCPRYDRDSLNTRGQAAHCIFTISEMGVTAVPESLMERCREITEHSPAQRASSRTQEDCRQLPGPCWAPQGHVCGHTASSCDTSTELKALWYQLRLLQQLSTCGELC